MNNILAGHTNSYHTYNLDESLAGIAKAGFKYVELSAVKGWTEHVLLDSTAADIAEVQAKMRHWGLQPSSLSGHSDLTTAAGVVDGKKAVDLCQKLGITLMCTAIGGHYSENEDKDAFMGHIHDLADYAAQRDVILALEIHGDIMATATLSVPLIQQIDRPNVLINYDTANCVLYGNTQAVDDIAIAAPYLVHVHLKEKAGANQEWNFPGIGEGYIDFKRVLSILDDANYTGPLSVEIEFQGEPWPPLAEVDRAMKVSYETLSGLGLK